MEFASLDKAVKTTFEARGTKVPKEPPLALTPEFYDDREKNAQWKAFLNKAKLNAEGKSLPEIAVALSSFLMPVSIAVAQGEIHEGKWHPGGPWT